MSLDPSPSNLLDETQLCTLVSAACESVRSLPASVPGLIAAITSSNPGGLAVSCGARELTYGELERQASMLASSLTGAGVMKGAPVGVWLDRSPDFIVSALAVLKAGGAYVPLNPEYPRERLGFIVSDANIRFVITDGGRHRDLASDSELVYLDVDAPMSNGKEFLETECSADDLAYIIYTSGSTGQPKGVQITHRGLMNLISWHHRAFGITPLDRASQVASISFDAAVWEIWPYLTAGASLFLIDDASRNDPAALRDWLLMNQITIAFAPTPIAEQMLRLLWPSMASLRILLTGGDRLHQRPRPGLPFTLVNNYGPTEATVVATSGVVSPGDASAEPSIGTPIDNTRIYILDEKLRPVPDGEIGELYIAGEGLAHGYVNRPDLTAAKFVNDPFSDDPSARMYRTGDLGVELPGGEIAFRGRNDDQLKIRGFRIEPGEIIAALNQHAAVRMSEVKALEEDQGEKRLAAYLVLNEGASPTAVEIRDFLREYLPEYMVPSFFIRVDAMPLTVHGKVDRNALPSPNSANLLRSGEALNASTAVEQQLLAIMQKLLNVSEINLQDDFFLLGGHSLLGAQLIAKVKAVFGVELTLVDLFENGTVAAMAAQIQNVITKRAA